MMHRGCLSSKDSDFCCVFSLTCLQTESLVSNLFHQKFLTSILMLIMHCLSLCFGCRDLRRTERISKNDRTLQASIDKLYMFKILVFEAVYKSLCFLMVQRCCNLYRSIFFSTQAPAIDAICVFRFECWHGCVKAAS